MHELHRLEGRGRLSRALAAWVGCAQRFPALTVAFCVATAALSLHYTFGRLGFKTDRDDLVNPSQAFVQNWKRYSEEFGGESDVVVIVGGSERSSMIAAVETIAREIEGFPRHFDKLCHRIEVDRLRAKGLYQLSLADLRSVQARIEAVRPMLLGSWDWMTVENFARDARLRIEAHPAGRPMDDAHRRALLSSAQLFESLASHLTLGNSYRSPWLEFLPDSASRRIQEIPEYFFSADGRFAFLRVAPKSQGSGDFVQHREAIGALRGVIGRIRPLYPNLEFGLTGVPVLESDEMEATKQGSKWSTILSAAGVLAVFTLAFRAFRHPLFAMASLVVAGCWTMGFVTLTIGHLNILTVSFIVTLIGLGIDYGILWISQFEAAQGAGASVRAANLEVARRVGPGTVVGAATTTVAFFTTMLHSFAGLRELGWVAAWGVAFCLLASITLVPALLALAGVAPSRKPNAARDLSPLLPRTSRRPALAAAATLLGAAALAAGLPRVQFDYNLLNLQPRGLASVEWERRLIEQTGTSGWYALSMANSAEEARRLAAELERLPTVGRVVEIASLIPADQPAKLPIVQSIHAALESLPRPSEAPGPAASNPSAVHQALLAVEESAAAASRTDILVGRVHRAAQEARRALAQLPPAEQARRLDKYQRLWVEDLLVQLHALRAVAGPEPVTVKDLPDSLVRRFYSPTGKWAIQVFARGSVWDMTPLQKFRDELASLDPEITGKPISTVHSLEQMADGFLLSGSAALLAILLCVWTTLGRLRLALLAMTPLLVGGGAMFGAMGWLGVSLNPANMIALPLILGIGIDYGVHVMHEYEASSGTYALSRRLGRSLLLNALTTILSFSSLSLAPHWGMVTIGIALAIGVATCATCSVVLLPALLAVLSRRRAADEEPAQEEAFDLPSTVHYRRVA